MLAWESDEYVLVRSELNPDIPAFEPRNIAIKDPKLVNAVYPSVLELFAWQMIYWPAKFSKHLSAWISWNKFLNKTLKL